MKFRRVFSGVYECGSYSILQSGRKRWTLWNDNTLIGEYPTLKAALEATLV